MNRPPTSADKASVSGGIANFGVLERKRQAVFRKGLATPSDAIGRRHDYLLALGCEEENLFSALRGENGACRYFDERNIKWWQAPASGDASDGKSPTRNMASSQIACVNFLLPLVDVPGALTAMLKAVDDDVTGVVDIEHQGTSCPVELEWIGLDHALEGPSVKSRGANSTSVDAFMVAETPTGRRVYLLEWKYVEEYRTEDKGQGRQGDTRRRRYAHLYEESPSFNAKVPSTRGSSSLSIRSCDFASWPTVWSRITNSGCRSKGHCRGAGRKSSVPRTHYITVVPWGVSAPNSLRHRAPDTRPPAEHVCNGPTVAFRGLSTREMWSNSDIVGLLPTGAIRMVTRNLSTGSAHRPVTGCWIAGSIFLRKQFRCAQNSRQ